jgi:DnaJ-class molecular chaperone
LEEIKGAFKRIVKELHPDTVGKNKNNTEKLTKVLEAYKILKDYNEQFKIPNIK